MKHLFATPCVRLLSLLLALTMLIGAFAACTTGENPADTTANGTEAVTDPTTEGAATDAATTPSEETTDEAVETDAETESDTEAETEDPSQRINKPTDPTHVTFYESKRPRLNQVFSNANQCSYEIVMDETYGSVLKLTTNPGAGDPHVDFNYAKYVNAHDLDVLSADEYKYIVLTVRVENCAAETFELFYAAGNVVGATGGYQTTATFNGTESGWQKLIFDLSSKDFSGDMNMFRFDFFTAGSAEGGDTMYIYSMDFYQTADEAYVNLDVDMTRPGTDSDLKEEAVPGVNYDKLNAPDEDTSVSLWFDHMTEKLEQTDTTASDMATYVISMAGNSIENCQFFLAPESDRNFRISMTDFTHANGNTLKTAILREHYVNINGKMIPDALPPLDGAVTVQGGHSQGFVVKVWADANEEAGLYSATLDVYDADTDEHIKTANVYVNLWDFSLSEETALKSAVNVSSWSIAVKYQNAGMLDLSGEELYKIYYDFLLENRLSAYQLPYSIGDSRVQAYLENPRVTSFAINKVNGGDEGGAYQIMKDHPRWLEKGYFYYVDEPTEMGKLNQLAEQGNRLSSTFPDYNQISPFFTNIQIDENTDQIEFMKPYLDIWCTKVFAFTPRDKYMIPGVQYMTTTAQDAKFGTFAERMAALQAEGDELWLYFCWEPGQPYANWLALGDGTEPIVSIWQCAMTNATGVLYWDSTYWTADPMNDLTPLIGATSHGDGVLIYPGSAVGSYEPISSFRLENIRLGVQDYQLLSMLEAEEGEAKADEMIAMVTTDVITYTNDDDYLHAVRVLLGNTVSEALKK